MPNFVLGKDGKAYYNATPLTEVGAVTGTELDNIKDVNTDLSTGESDITTRANNGWEATAATLKKGVVTFKMIWKPGDAGFDAIQSAWENSAEIALMFLDGPVGTAGSQGLSGNFSISNFSRDEQLTEAMVVDVTAKPSSFTSWHKVAAS